MQGPWWHQWQLNGHCKSLVGINDNLINNLPLYHWWRHPCNNSCSDKIMLPLSSSFSPPLASMAKGTHMSMLLHMSSLPSVHLSTCCSPCHDALSTWFSIIPQLISSFLICLLSTLSYDLFVEDVLMCTTVKHAPPVVVLYFYSSVMFLCTCQMSLLASQLGHSKIAHTHCQRIFLVSILYSIRLPSSRTIRVYSTAIIRYS